MKTPLANTDLLSAKQRRALTFAQESKGGLVTPTHIVGWCCYSIAPVTLVSLVKRGLLEARTRNDGYVRYYLTDAGRRDVFAPLDNVPAGV